MVIWGGMAAGAMGGGGGGGGMLGGILGGSGMLGGGQSSAAPQQSGGLPSQGNFGTRVLNAFFGGGMGGGGGGRMLGGDLDMMLQSGQIGEGQYYKLKALQHEEKYKYGLWQKNAAYEEWLQGADVGEGVRARPVGPGPQELNDAEKKYLGIPTSWETNASNQIKAIMTGPYDEATQNKMLLASDDLTREYAGLPVYSMEQKKKQAMASLELGYAYGTLTEDQAKARQKLNEKPLTAAQQITKEEVADWSGMRVRWLKYLNENNKIESDLTRDELQHHTTAALGSHGAAVKFEYLQGIYGNNVTAKTAEKALSDFELAKARFLPQIDEHPTLTNVQKMHLQQVVLRAKSYDALRRARGPNGEDFSDYAYDGVKVVENEIMLEQADLADRKLRASVFKAEDDARLARLTLDNYESPAAGRARKLKEKIAEEERALQGKKDIAEFIADIRAKVASGELGGLKSVTGSSMFSGMTRLLIANSDEYGTPFLEPEDATMMEDLLVDMAEAYKKKMEEAADAEEAD